MVIAMGLLSLYQCCKFLLPRRPRLPGLDSGYLLPEAGSPGGRPKMSARYTGITCYPDVEL